MPNPDITLYDVIIAGAGPVGLFLACELRLGGCSVLVLEQARDPHFPLKGLPFGLRGLSVPTIESFDRRDLLDAIEAGAVDSDAPAAAHWKRQKRQPAGHFAGIQFFHDQIDSQAWPYRLPNPVDSIASDMESIEGVLADRAMAMGIEIRRGRGVESFEQSEQDVTVRAGAETVRGRWLVGCDGGRGTVRKAAGIGFTGTDPEFTGYSAEGELAATWTDRAYQATAYRSGRVLLAGDAAHIHSPLGGQGLNLGLDDAMNLGWKLAATIRGEAPAGLLDSYERERHPVDGRPSRRTFAGPIDHVSGDVKDRLGLSALLVRPDGIVAWATDLAEDDEGLVQASARWFGVNK